VQVDGDASQVVFFIRSLSAGNTVLRVNSEGFQELRLVFQPGDAVVRPPPTVVPAKFVAINAPTSVDKTTCTVVNFEIRSKDNKLAAFDEIKEIKLGTGGLFISSEPSCKKWYPRVKVEAGQSRFKVYIKSAGGDVNYLRVMTELFRLRLKFAVGGGAAPPAPPAPAPPAPPAPTAPPAPVTPVVPPVPKTPGTSFLQPYLRGLAGAGCAWEVGQVGCANEWWNMRVDTLPVSPQSAAVIRYLDQAESSMLGDPNVAHDADTKIGDPPAGRRQEALWRMDRGSTKMNENYGHNVHYHDGTPSGGFVEFQIRDETNPFATEKDWYPKHCDLYKTPIVGSGKGESNAIRIQANPAGGTCGPNKDPVSSQGDCHYYTIDLLRKELWEGYHSYGVGNGPPGFSEFGRDAYSQGCVAKWDLKSRHNAEFRGWSTTSANAAGVPYVPFVVTPGEIKSGRIKHSLAVAFFNEWIRPNEYVRAEGPNTNVGGATHSSFSTQNHHYADKSTVPGNTKAMPGWNAATMEQPAYGSRWRLKNNFQIDPKWPNAVKVLYQAMKEYGVYLIDGSGGGTFMPLTHDAFDDASWEDVNDGQNLHPLSFELYGNLGWQGNVFFAVLIRSLSLFI
jgi:hypothetical protein